MGHQPRGDGALRPGQPPARPAAIEDGDFAREIAPYGAIAADEGPRADTTLEKMAALKPLREGGRITAALASQISDGAAALLIASEQAVDRHELTPGPDPPPVRPR